MGGVHPVSLPRFYQDLGRFSQQPHDPESDDTLSILYEPSNNWREGAASKLCSASPTPSATIRSAPTSDPPDVYERNDRRAARGPEPSLRINWLFRQLAEAPSDLRVEVASRTPARQPANCSARLARIPKRCCTPRTRNARRDPSPDPRPPWAKSAAKRRDPSSERRAPRRSIFIASSFSRSRPGRRGAPAPQSSPEEVPRRRSPSRRPSRTPTSARSARQSTPTRSRTATEHRDAPTPFARTSRRTDWRAGREQRAGVLLSRKALASRFASPAIARRHQRRRLNDSVWGYARWSLGLVVLRPAAAPPWRASR